MIASVARALRACHVSRASAETTTGTGDAAPRAVRSRSRDAPRADVFARYRLVSFVLFHHPAENVRAADRCVRRAWDDVDRGHGGGADRGAGAGADAGAGDEESGAPGERFVVAVALGDAGAERSGE